MRTITNRLQRFTRSYLKHAVFISFVRRVYFSLYRRLIFNAKEEAKLYVTHVFYEDIKNEVEEGLCGINGVNDVNIHRKTEKMRQIARKSGVK